MSLEGPFTLNNYLTSSGRVGVLYIASKSISGLKTALAGIILLWIFGGGLSVSAMSMQISAKWPN